ncbi:MAG: hypothetical protein ACRD2L_00675 [Terriglobia bacterium]
MSERAAYDNQNNSQKQNKVEESVMGGETGICSRFLGSHGQRFLLAVGISSRTAHDHRRQRGDRGYQV